MADAPLDALGNQKAQAQQAVNAALASAKTMLGKNEVPNHQELQSYLQDGGQDLDPHKLAWCAAFVSASLQKAGLPVPTQVVKGSAFGPGAYAPNYLTYGSAVDPKNVQAGDILVANNGTHVGFAEGPTRQGPNGPEAQLLAGNEQDPSGQYAPGSYISPTGAVANRSQVGMVGERWVPLSQYSARRYEPTDTQDSSPAAPSQGTMINSTAQQPPHGVSLSPTDRDYVVRTLAGEEGNPTGWNAVANVIKNRLGTGSWGNTAQSVVLSPGQFSNWNKVTGFAGGAGANDLGQNLQAGSSRYNQIGQVVDDVFSGASADPTKGALNYYAPGGMKGGKPPPWAAEMTNPITIGAQVYGTAASQIPTRPARPVTTTPGTAVAAAAPAGGGIGTTINSLAGTPDKPSPFMQGASELEKGLAGQAPGQDQGQGAPQVRPVPIAQPMPPHMGPSPQQQMGAQIFGTTLNSMQTPLHWGSAPWGVSPYASPATQGGMPVTAGTAPAGVPQGEVAQQFQQLQQQAQMQAMMQQYGAAGGLGGLGGMNSGGYGYG